MDATVTRAVLVDLTRERIGLSKEESRKAVDTLLQILEDRLRAGESVKISGFGTFTVKHKHTRLGRNPRTGTAITIAPRRVVSFKASQVLKERVAKRREIRLFAGRVHEKRRDCLDYSCR